MLAKMTSPPTQTVAVTSGDLQPGGDERTVAGDRRGLQREHLLDEVRRLEQAEQFTAAQAIKGQAPRSVEPVR